jgi:hypothetical protein
MLKMQKPTQVAVSALLFLMQASCAAMHPDTESAFSATAKQPVKQNPEENESKFVKPETIQGCYQLETLNWKPDLKLGEDEVFITPPQRIQILAERGSIGFEKNGYLVRAAPGSPKSIHRASYWEPTGPKTIDIVFSTGTSGVSMRLKVEGDILRGKAKTHWDFPRRDQTAQVIAHKIDCENNR